MLETKKVLGDLPTALSNITDFKLQQVNENELKSVKNKMGN
jgi:hypothetical protein